MERYFEVVRLVGERIERLNELISRTTLAELKSPLKRKSNFENVHAYSEKLDFSKGANSPGVMELDYLMEFSKLLDKPATKENREEYYKYRNTNVYELYKALYSHAVLLALEINKVNVEPDKFDASKVSKSIEVKAREMTRNFIEDLESVSSEISSNKSNESKVRGVIEKFTSSVGNFYGTRSEKLANQALQVTLYDFDLQKVGNYLKAYKLLKEAQEQEAQGAENEQKIKSLQRELEENKRQIEKVSGIAGLSGIKPFPEEQIKPLNLTEKGTLAIFARLNASRMFGKKPSESDRRIIEAYKQYVRYVSKRTMRFVEEHANFIHPKQEYDQLYFVPMFASSHEVPESILRNVSENDLASAKAYYMLPGKGGKVRILGVYLAQIKKEALPHYPSFNHFLLTRMLGSMVKGIV